LKKTILLVLFLCINTYASQTLPAGQIVELNDAQKNMLYEFAVLQKNGSEAEIYWQKHKDSFPTFDKKVRDQVAHEIFINYHVVYLPVKDSAVHLWIRTQSLTNWMLYLAAFVAICAIIGLLRDYWNLLIGILIRQFAPLFRLFFSAILLTYELLLIGAVSIVWGCYVEDIAFRALLIHVGLFLLWSQSTAILTKKYLVKKYLYEIKSNYWKKDNWETVKTICLPALVVTLALLYVLYKVPDEELYNYEIVFSGMAFVCSLPFWRVVEQYMYPILIPFKDTTIERSIYPFAACVVLALIIDGFLIWQQNPLFYYIIIALTTLLFISFLVLSLKENYKRAYKNYYYMQLVTVAFILFVLWYSFTIHSAEMIWVSLIGTSVFLVIKYWEIPTFFFSWKRYNTWTWGFLGMAILLWLLAKGILYISHILLV
jgi:hypothetical protein